MTHTHTCVKCRLILPGRKMDRRCNFRATSNFLHSRAFKEYIFHFDRLLDVKGREWFRFWCMNVVPRGRLDALSVDADHSVLKVVEFLLDNKGMPFIMSIVRRFLLETGCSKSLERLGAYELRVIVDILLENYVTSNFLETASSFYADALRLMATTRRKSEERISEIFEARDKFMQVDEDVRALELLNNVIQECRRSPEFSWYEVTKLLTITGEWYTSVSLDYDKVSIIDLTSKIGESFADWMLKLGGLVSMLRLSKCIFFCYNLSKCLIFP